MKHIFPKHSFSIDFQPFGALQRYLTAVNSNGQSRKIEHSTAARQTFSESQRFKSFLFIAKIQLKMTKIKLTLLKIYLILCESLIKESIKLLKLEDC